MDNELNEIFHQVTIRICGSLDIETAMGNTFEYLLRILPLEGLYLSYEDTSPQPKISFAIVSRQGVTYKAWDAYISDAARATMRELKTRYNSGEAVLLNNPDLHPELKEFSHHMLPVSHIASNLGISLTLDGVTVGALNIWAKNPNCFTRRHASILRMLREPFAIAMANIRQHHELLELKNRVTDDNRYLSQELMAVVGDHIIGEKGGLNEVMQKIHQVSPLDTPVLILGETGAGKEVIANAIHNQSNRHKGPFIKVNCGAIPENLIDTELFGHEKGAFTGAATLKRGRFERAHNGTIFLDEIGELPLSAQVRLLRVLQQHEIERVGGTQVIPVHIRVIAATHRDLWQMVEDGLFRKDLMFRLNVFPVVIPPLRQRLQDIPDLVAHFVSKKATEMKLQTPPPVDTACVAKLSQYRWPGNIRELENVVERALIRSMGRPSDLPLIFEPVCDCGAVAPTAAPVQSAEPLEPLDQHMRSYIERVLSFTQGKIHGPNGAASILRINSSTLRTRMIKLGISFRKSSHF
ncbi:sigma 54-interacting transcriptional regulator [Desulfoluna sp.]|uniref:sigma-54-dependent Fis family transcriptional regulator n=1 Tax=Desulfoluna sp. TaxID=2045199 RepID=UPI0026269B18|nr:sigma 54-interacting transcriptional regulator [Desulfoluna sp.]